MRGDNDENNHSDRLASHVINVNRVQRCDDAHHHTRIAGCHIHTGFTDEHSSNTSRGQAHAARR